MRKIALITAGIVLVSFVIAWILYLKNPYSNYQESFSSYGNFIAGTLGVLLSAFNVYFLLLIWNNQKNESYKQGIEARFFNLLAIRKEMRTEIRPYTNSITSHSGGYEKVFGNERGNDAINKIANSFSGYQENYKGKERLSMLSSLYRMNSDYLRHYFDFILFILEYIDNQKVLDESQKIDYIRVLKADSSYNEMFIWMLMMHDYEQDDSLRQDARLVKLDKKYDLFAGKVFTVPEA